MISSSICNAATLSDFYPKIFSESVTVVQEVAKLISLQGKEGDLHSKGTQTLFWQVLCREV